MPVIVRGEGAYVWDQHGKRYLDGLAGLFTSQLGHGRTELAEAGAKQAETLAYFPLWTYAHPRAIELAERLAELRPGRPQPGLLHHGRLRGGGVGLEAGPPVLPPHRASRSAPRSSAATSPTTARPWARSPSRASPTCGPRSSRWCPARIKVPNTNFYRAELFADDEVAFGRWAADEIERAILQEGPETVAAVFLEPVQNAGGCFPPPPGYFQRVREICDRHGVLLVSDEVICAFGRLGHWFGALRYDYQPDIITVAKGLTSGYAPLGRHDRLGPPHGAVPRARARRSCTASPSPATR